MLSLEDLDLATKGESPLIVDYVTADGVETGVRLHILGEESATVKAVIHAELEKRAQRIAAIEALSSGGRGAAPKQNLNLEVETAHSNRMTAARLVGWSGLKEQWSPENALKLVSRNSDVAAFVLEVSKRTSDFLQLKSKA